MPGLGIGLAPGHLAWVRGSGLWIPSTPYSDAWAAAVTSRGGTYSAGTLAAMRAFEQDLAYAGLTNRFAYLNLRCGNDLIAARSPLIAAAGPGFDSTSGTFNTWNETQGLKGTTGIIDTGVSPSAAGITSSAAALGMYCLSDFGNLNPSMYDTVGGFELTLSYNSQYIIFDTFAGAGSGRTQTDSTLINDGTGGKPKGLITGTRYGANSAGVYRNGIARGVGTGAANNSPSATSVKLTTALGAVSGGDLVGSGIPITPDDAAILTWIFHDFNKALGRGVTAEGLS